MKQFKTTERIAILTLVSLITTGCGNSSLSDKEVAEYNELNAIREELNTEIDFTKYIEFVNLFVNRNRVSLEILEEELSRLAEEQLISNELATKIVEKRKEELTGTPIVGVDDYSVSTEPMLEFEETPEEQRKILLEQNENLEMGRTSVYKDMIVFRYSNILLQSMYYTLEIEDGKVVNVYENI